MNETFGIFKAGSFFSGSTTVSSSRRALLHGNKWLFRYWKKLHTLQLTMLINEREPVSKSDKWTLAFFIRGILQWRQMWPWASCCALVAMCFSAPWHTTFLWKVSFNSDELFVCGARGDMLMSHRKDMQRPSNRMVQREDERMLLTN